MRDAFWTLAAFLLVIFSLLLSYLLTKKSVISKEGGRKLVHMLVSFTVPMIVCGIENPLLRLAGPFVFMIVNGAAGRKMGGRTAGLVCYPLSILLLTAVMNAGYLSPRAVISSAFVMGIGDGAAALAGERWGRHRAGGKTLEGSAAMLLVSFIIFLIAGEELLPALFIAAAAAAAEALTPHGLDNLSVPLLSSLLMELL